MTSHGAVLSAWAAGQDGDCGDDNGGGDCGDDNGGGDCGDGGGCGGGDC
jgi:hypothetical protein